MIHLSDSNVDEPLNLGLAESDNLILGRIMV